MTTTHAWVVGARGLLGASVAARMAGAADWVVVDTDPLPWSEPDAGVFDDAVRSGAERMLASSAGSPWAVVWCAGVAVTGSTAAQLERERDQLQRVLDILAWAIARHAGPPGSFFYASSAGGVYAGADAPPFTETTPPRPLAPYGHAKLRSESMVAGFGAATGTKVLVGRIANLYGPGQSIGKSQGLITQLAKANFSPEPASIYVPLETVRDYIYADDCAGLVVDALWRLVHGDDVCVTKIFASHQAVTIAALLGHFTALHKSRPHVMLGMSPTAGYQAVDLRLRSVVWTDLDSRDQMPLPVGIYVTAQAIIAAMQAGSLAR